MKNYLSSNHFKKWQHISKWHFLKLVLLVNLVHILVRILGYKKVQLLICKLIKPSKQQFFLLDIEDTRRLKKIINPLFNKIRDSKYWMSNCLSSSLLLWGTLEKQGLTTKIVVGTQKRDKNFKAHAWVEYNSLPLNEYKKVTNNYVIFEHDFSIN